MIQKIFCFKELPLSPRIYVTTTARIKVGELIFKSSLLNISSIMHKVCVYTIYSTIKRMNVKLMFCLPAGHCRIPHGTTREFRWNLAIEHTEGLRGVWPCGPVGYRLLQNVDLHWGDRKLYMFTGMVWKPFHMRFSLNDWYSYLSLETESVYSRKF